MSEVLHCDVTAALSSELLRSRNRPYWSGKECCLVGFKTFGELLPALLWLITSLILASYAMSLIFFGILVFTEVLLDLTLPFVPNIIRFF